MKKIISTKAPIVIEDVKGYTFYKPLENTDSCKGCHAQEGAILGAVKVSLSIEKEYEKGDEISNNRYFADNRRRTGVSALFSG